MRIAVFAALLLASCAPSPLFVSHRPQPTPGEIPRDAWGEPMWDRIRAPRRVESARVPQPVPVVPPAPASPR